MNDEFYIGWEAKTPPGVASRVHRAVMLLAALAVALGAVLAIAQHTIGVSVFEWGKIKNFSGVFQSAPYPHLLVARPGASNAPTAFSSYYLVKPFKFGIDAATADALDGKFVTLKGTLIYRQNQTMIEVAGGTLKAATGPGSEVTNALALQPVSLGRQTLTGEIVDSKCFLGVMNPGQLEPHRACAINCIRGGIPPVLLVRQKDGPALYLLLVSADGKPVNDQILDLVAEPVEITGEVTRQGDSLTLRANPATYRLVGH